MDRAALLCIAVVAVGAFAGGCGGGSSGPGNGNGTDATFSGDVQPVFTQNCASSDCHGAAESAGLRLTQGVARQELVNVASTSEPAFLRVAPGDPDTSYVVIKLEGNQSVGERMPRGAQPLSPATIQVIRDWIDQGAADN